MRASIASWGGLAAAAAAMSVAAAVVWLRRRYVAVTVEGVSMLPTFQPGDWVLVRRVALPAIRGGQVVVVAAAGSSGPGGAVRAGRALARGGWLIKRAAAIPGDPVPAELAGRVRAEPGAVVPTGRLLVLGDNQKASIDSRSVGYIAGDDLLGVAVRRLGPRRHDADGLDTERHPAPAVR